MKTQVTNNIQFYILDVRKLYPSNCKISDRPRRENGWKYACLQKGDLSPPDQGNSRGRKGRRARPLEEEHLHQSHYTENLEIPSVKRFHVSQFPMAVGRACTGVVNLLEYIFVELVLSLSLSLFAARGCSNCRPDPRHLFSAAPDFFSSRNHSSSPERQHLTRL